MTVCVDDAQRCRAVRLLRIDYNLRLRQARCIILHADNKFLGHFSVIFPLRRHGDRRLTVRAPRNGNLVIGRPGGRRGFLQFSHLRVAADPGERHLHLVVVFHTKRVRLDFKLKFLRVHAHGRKGNAVN